MKHIVILFLLFASFVNYAQAQDDYIPLVKDGRTWTYLYSKCVDNSETATETYCYTLTLQGDTTINGKQYAKCYYKSTRGSVLIKEDVPYGFIREEDRKVYAILNPDNHMINYYSLLFQYLEPTEEIIYDFNDMVSFCRMLYYFHYSHLVRRVEETTFEGVTRKKYVMDTDLGSVIEGIGIDGAGDLLDPYHWRSPCICCTNTNGLIKVEDPGNVLIYKGSRYTEAPNIDIRIPNFPIKPNGENDIYLTLSNSLPIKSLVVNIQLPGGITFEPYAQNNQDSMEDNNIWAKALFRAENMKFKADTIANVDPYDNRTLLRIEITGQGETLLPAAQDEDLSIASIHVRANDKWTAYNQGLGAVICYRFETENGSYRIYTTYFRAYQGASVNDLKVNEAKSTDTRYYNMKGVAFDTKPTEPGIYIHQGRKVVVK